MKAVRDRNERVELDKTWETSWIRMIVITILTYVFASTFLYLIEVPHYFLSSIVPAFGFILSVQSIPMIKKWWISKRSNNQ